MKVLILHKNESQACNMASAIQADLKEKEIEAVVLSRPQPVEDMQDYCLAIVLGGDGTILETAHFLADSQIPLLGINFGKIGFLSSIDPDEWPLTLAKLMHHEYSLEKRMMIEVQIIRDGQAFNLGRALNDAVIRSQVLHIMTLRLSVDGRPYSSYRADGIICATPTGSTAYSYSAGGPVLAGDLEAMLVTPICPQLSCARALVLKAGALLEFAIECDCNAGIALDGEKEMDLIRGDRILVKKSQQSVNLVRFTQISSIKKLMSCRNKISGL